MQYGALVPFQTLQVVPLGQMAVAHALFAVEKYHVHAHAQSITEVLIVTDG